MRRRSSTTSSASWRCRISSRHDLAHVDPREIVGETGLGSSDQELEDAAPPAMPATKFVSKGLTRGLAPQMMVVRGNTALAVDPMADTGVTALHETVTTTRTETTLLTVEAQVASLGKPGVQAVGVTLTTAERRAEARVRGYEGGDCSDCGNFTLVRNGTCLKCDTCGSTSGCS